MRHFLKITLAGLIILVGLTACKKAQEESAEAAKETITEIKASTLDAAHDAVSKTEQAADAIAKAAEDAGATQPEAETNEK